MMVMMMVMTMVMMMVMLLGAPDGGHITTNCFELLKMIKMMKTSRQLLGKFLHEM